MEVTSLRTPITYLLNRFFLEAERIGDKYNVKKDNSAD